MLKKLSRLIKALIGLYLICTVVVGAVCLVLHPLIEFSWWRVTGLFVLAILGLLW